MKKEEIDAIRDKIINEIDSLETDIISLVEASKPVAPDVAIGRLTRMEAINSKGINEANLRSSKSRLSGPKRLRYSCIGSRSVEEPPSPNSQSQVSVFPHELLVNCTSNGSQPSSLSTTNSE